MKEAKISVPVSSQVSTHLATIEAPAVTLIPAPVFKRFLAYAIDLGLVATVEYIILMLITWLVAGSAGIAKLLGFFNFSQFAYTSATNLIFFGFLCFLVVSILAVVHDGYFIFWESSQGTTIGKRLLGMQVIAVNRAQLSLRQVTIRHLFRYLDCLAIFPGLISLISTQGKQRLGDLAASTMVVYSAQRDDEVTHLYLAQSDYFWLIEVLKPRRVSLETARAYLKFAYPEFVIRPQLASPEILAQWEAVVLLYVTIPAENTLDQSSLLRFFAEFCFQTLKWEA